MDIITLLLAQGYTDTVAKSLAGGLKYQGSKPTVADLPAASSSNKGHMYTIVANGHEYVSDGTQWIDLSADLDKKADKTYVDQQDAQKINLLGNVDDPSDPGYGFAYHFPYDASFTPSEDKITIGLKTITLDNNKYKMTFDKELPAATNNNIGLMKASDAKAVREDLPAAITAKQDKLTAGTNITIENNVISASGALSPEYISLGNYVDGDTGTLTEAQAEVLLASELNYIWLNGMHRLDFRYRDDYNNKATYATCDSSSDGTKTHSIEINLTTREFKVYHKQLQEKLTAGDNITISANTISAVQPDISGKADKTYVDTQDALKQDKLTAGDNITIDTNNKISATVTTYRPLKSEWKQTSTYGGITMSEFCGHINDDPSVKEGDAYCGNINSKNFFSGMYFEDAAHPLESAEVNVQIMGAWGTGHVQLLTVTSSNHAPYFWQYTWVDGLASWVSWTDVRKLNTSEATNYLKYLSLNGTEYKLPDGDTIESNISTLNTSVTQLSDNMGGLKIKALTQTDYDNLEKKDENTLYFIIKKA